MADRLASLYPAHLQSPRPVIFAGAHHMIFLDDMPYPFKANPQLKAWLQAKE